MAMGWLVSMCGGGFWAQQYILRNIRNIYEQLLIPVPGWVRHLLPNNLWCGLAHIRQNNTILCFRSPLLKVFYFNHPLLHFPSMGSPEGHQRQILGKAYHRCGVMAPGANQEQSEKR